MAYSNTRHPNHDYRSKASYLITCNKRQGVEPFSILMGGRKHPAPHPGVKYSGIGKVIAQKLRMLPTEFPQARILQYVIMPDHLHFVLDIKQPTEYHIGTIVNALKTWVGSMVGEHGIFEDGYHDRIKRRYGQLRNMIDYVADNPRRLLTKIENPEFFSKPFQLELFGKRYCAYGNSFLLNDPMISPVRISRRMTQSELEMNIAEWQETIRTNGVLASPFISGAEKEILNYGIKGGAKIILITRDEMGEKYKPSGRLFDLCAEGRLLIISTLKALEGTNLSRAEALDMNELANKISCRMELSQPKEQINF